MPTRAFVCSLSHRLTVVCLVFAVHSSILSKSIRLLHVPKLEGSIEGSREHVLEIAREARRRDFILVTRQRPQEHARLGLVAR